jgi:hypothetical protein
MGLEDAQVDSAAMLSDPSPEQELAREREEVRRLRDLLITRDAELGAARGRVLELEARSRYLRGAARRLRALSPEFLWRIANGLRKPRG